MKYSDDEMISEVNWNLFPIQYAGKQAQNHNDHYVYDCVQRHVFTPFIQVYQGQDTLFRSIK
jgi:hypothetical protein